MFKGLTEQQTRERLRERAERAFPLLARCEEVTDYWVGAAGMVDRLRVVGRARNAEGALERQIEVSVPVVGAPSLVFERTEEAPARRPGVTVRGGSTRAFMDQTRPASGAGMPRTAADADEHETAY